MRILPKGKDQKGLEQGYCPSSVFLSEKQEGKKEKKKKRGRFYRSVPLELVRTKKVLNRVIALLLFF